MHDKAKKMNICRLEEVEITNFGISAANELTVNEDIAPRPTNVFMFGVPRIRLFIPSTISWRPGTSNVNKDKDMWKPVECIA